MQIISLLLICASLFGHHKVHSEEATAVQIVQLENQSISVNSNLIQQILGSERIKDRHVVVFSIAGPYRKGKSFFLNFPLKYLRAQYVKHDISDWLDETRIDKNELNGFKWRGGQKPETSGIWMWSEIFTHDFDNGDRVAIILLDTQGIYDHESSFSDSTTTFAISMLLSSVQCYNVMQNVQEDNLQDLDYFSQYGRLAKGLQSNEKPFQHLLFLVRDWPYATEMDYGYAPEYVDRLLETNDKQSFEMHTLRDNIKSSFDTIEAFLMPYPGTAVAEGRNTNGDMRQVDTRFIQSVKEIVPSIFAPDKLAVKQINGQKIRAQDFVTFLEKYAEIFNGKTLPEPKTALMATAETSLLILLKNCLGLYQKKMYETMDRHNFFRELSDFEIQHHQARNEALKQFRTSPKLHVPGLVSFYETQLENDIAHDYVTFMKLNLERLMNDQQRQKWNHQEYATSHDNSRSNIIQRLAVSGFSGTLCAAMGWNPFVATACALGGLAATLFA